MNIRHEAPSDARAVRAFIEAAFASEAEADLVDALSASGFAEISLVADDAGEIIGHILLSRLIAPARSLTLAPLSVAPQRQRQGVGSSLVRAAIDHAAKGQWSAIFVLGAPLYYRRFGFTTEAAAGFQSPYPTEFFMALALTPGALDAVGGLIRYPAPFGDLDRRRPPPSPRVTS